MTSQNSNPRQTVLDGDLAAATVAVRAEMLRDVAIEFCEVSVREPVTGEPILAAWVVPRGPVQVDRLQRLQREVSDLTQWRVELVPVSALPLSDQGSVNSKVLEQIEVVDQELLDKWEAALASLPEIGRVAVVARQRDSVEQRLHLSDLIPQWKALLAQAMPDPSLRPRDPDTSNHPGAPRPLACRAGAGDPLSTVPPTLVKALKQTAERDLGERIIVVGDDGSAARDELR